MKRSFIIAAVLALALCLSAGEARAYTAYEPVKTQICVVRQVCTITAWHYSGGYWMAENGSGSRVKIPDSAVKSSGFAAALSGSLRASWTIRVPDAVLTARRNGASIITEIPASGQYYSKIVSRTQGAAEIRVSAVPVIKTSGKTLKDYVPGIRANIPLVSREHGRNLYALYGNGLWGETAVGSWSESQPGRVFSPYIHPAMIKNSLGGLVADGSVYVGGKMRPSKGFSVGLLTLMRGGAVGVQFDIPITVFFYAETLVPVVRTPEPEGPEPEPQETEPLKEPEHGPEKPLDPKPPKEPETPPEEPRFRIDDYMLHRAY